MYDFTGNIILITGGESGLGRATVEAFARAKGTVIIAGFMEDVGKETVDALVAEGLQVEFIRTDVTSEEQIKNVVSRVLEKHGKIDVLVNNASIFDGFCGVAETTTGLWDRVINTNLKGTFLMSREVIQRDMMERGKGTIVHMASVGGLIGGADGLAYTASKFGVIGLTRQMAVDLSAKGIKVNAVCPGMIPSELRKHSTRILGDDAPNMARGASFNPHTFARIPMGRKGEPADIANAVLFLSTPYSDYLAGHSLVVDGGWTIQ